MILATCAVLMSLACFANEGRHTFKGFNRSLWMLYGIAAGIGVLSGNWFVAGFLLLVTYNLSRSLHPMQHYVPWSILVACAALYGMGRQDITGDMRTFGLYLLTAIGCLQGVWAIYSLWQYPGPYRHRFFWEYRRGLIDCGQENHNHTQGLSILCTVAAAGVAVVVTPWWWIMAAWSLLPLLAVQWATTPHWTAWKSITQGIVHLWHAVLAVLVLWLGWWSAAVIVPYLAFVAWYLAKARQREDLADSGRVHHWAAMLIPLWWKFGWRVRLFGHGWDSWGLWAARLAELRYQMTGKKPQALTVSHNEFVQIAFEQGLIGLLCVLGFIGQALINADPVYFVLGVTLCSIASLNNPWTWWQRVFKVADQQPVNRKERRTREAIGLGAPPIEESFGVGSPGLVAVSIFLAIVGG